MIKAIFPTNSFDQFLSSYEEEEDHAKQQQIRYKRYQSNFLINRQTNMSSIPSSSFLINYQSNNILSKPSLCATLRMLQYKQEKLSSIVNV
ncbi:unnamed protein product [Rotaria sordida]|uniref:Uncharacterized protein n=1 Tax=Rotaria sordida TaxID=392033 RepID=A0A819Q679_9BILA|nr:unnamed protein product [Rotaria sordida]